MIRISPSFDVTPWSSESESRALWGPKDHEIRLARTNATNFISGKAHQLGYKLDYASIQQLGAPRLEEGRSLGTQVFRAKVRLTALLSTTVGDIEDGQSQAPASYSDARLNLEVVSDPR